MQAILKIRMLGVRGALLAVLAAGMVLPSAQGQSSKPNQKSDNKGSGSTQAQPPGESSKAVGKESAPANKEQAGGPQEGIKVHGHWVIDVRNPDGKLVTHHEFENDYIGNTFLARVLSRQNAVGLWQISLQPSGHNPPLGVIAEPNDPNVQASKNLTLSTSGTKFVLTGSLTADVFAAIDSVDTFVTYCDPNIAPVSPCISGPQERFTGTGLFPFVNVIPGQSVQVSVTFTFS